MTEIRTVKTDADYKAAMIEVARLWGAKSGTPAGARLDVLVTLVEVYEQEHFPIEPHE